MQATADMGNGKQEEEIDVMILRSLTTSAMLSGGIGAETRGDIAAHGNGSERFTDGTGVRGPAWAMNATRIRTKLGEQRRPCR